MTLPQHYSRHEDYFQDCMDFFEEYQNLYNLANTDVLIEGVFNSIKIDDWNEVEVIDASFDIRALAEKNYYLKRFFKKLDKLQVIYDYIEENVEHSIHVPLKPKKKHEIVRLAKEIDYLCRRTGCDTIVDFGSGLGYLDQVIFEMTKYKVLGLECNDSHYVGAKARQYKYYPKSEHRVKYIKHTITDQSYKDLERLLYEIFPKSKEFCITGLHSCADLTVDAINNFLIMPKAKSMVLMPCCYHKMRLDDGSEGKLVNFPLSNCLNQIYVKQRGYEYLRIPFLRLAAHPYCFDQSHIQNMVFNLLARGVLQLFAFKYKYKLERRKRKAVRVKKIKNDFASYARDACTHGFTFIKDPSWPDKSVGSSMNQNDIFEQLKLMWNELSPFTIKTAAVFIILQNCLQPVIENFILLDRIVYLKERGVLNATCKKIVNNEISPRCLALCAYK